MTKLYFEVTRLNPDRRQFQQQTIELAPYPPLLVAVEAEASVNSEGASVITPEELKRISDMFETLFNGTIEPTGTWEEEATDEGWPTIDPTLE